MEAGTKEPGNSHKAGNIWSMEVTIGGEVIELGFTGAEWTELPQPLTR